jgi:hypothetical protein
VNLDSLRQPHLEGHPDWEGDSEASEGGGDRQAGSTYAGEDIPAPNTAARKPTGPEEHVGDPPPGVRRCVQDR